MAIGSPIHIEVALAAHHESAVMPGRCHRATIVCSAHPLAFKAVLSLAVHSVVVRASFLPPPIPLFVLAILFLRQSGSRKAEQGRADENENAGSHAEKSEQERCRRESFAG